MCQFSFGISSQHLNISHCSEPKTVFVAPPFPTEHARALTCAPSSHSGRTARLFALKGSKDNLPGLEKPSAPAIPDCFGGVSINAQ